MKTLTKKKVRFKRKRKHVFDEEKSKIQENKENTLRKKIRK